MTANPRPRVFVCARVRPSQPGDGLPVADATRLEVYADAAMLDSINMGEAPFPWPGLSRVLDDATPDDRAAALAVCLTWLAAADRVAVYVDLGVSAGMLGEIERAHALKIPVEVRSINILT